PMKRIILLACVLLLSVAGMARAETAPEELVRATADQILAEIKAHRDVYAKDYTKLYKMADEKVLLHFDFRRMSQWVLGRFWKEATPEQRDRFTSEFRDLLVGTYSQALLNYNDQKIVYLPVQRKPDDTEVTVKTEVKQTGGQPNIPIHYSFYKNKDGAWKVYDITIEGVSLVTNYRSVYATKIREKGMDALIAEIADNNRQKRAAGTAKK
ncbi:MAG TPA: ABC transporter substrate-binding protein, partial [Acidiferrobacterales bacterium]|nr:ABC transporter substrate-binding protein [Acidiferrobacterales bacterium]